MDLEKLTKALKNKNAKDTSKKIKAVLGKRQKSVSKNPSFR